MTQPQYVIPFTSMDLFFEINIQRIMKFLFEYYPDTYDLDYPLFRIETWHHNTSTILEGLRSNLKIPGNKMTLDLLNGISSVIFIQLDNDDHALLLAIAIGLTLTPVYLGENIHFYNTNHIHKIAVDANCLIE